MSVIQTAVGPDMPNSKADVMIVQRLLNEHLRQLAPLPPLREDGKFGPKTENAILEFQSRVVRLAKPDGCVHPHGPTLLALTHQATPAHRHHITPAYVNAFIKMALPVARAVKVRWGVPVSVVIAQSALESSWGRSVVGNAYFGIKGKAPSGDSSTFATTEVVNGKVIHIKDQFRAYKDYADAADDYGRFLNQNSGYKPCFRYKNNPIKFVEEVARAGYATDPHYAKSLISIIHSYGLEQYDRHPGKKVAGPGS